MKLFPATGAIIICLAGSALRAQDAPLPKPETQDPAEPAFQLPTLPPAATPAPQLIPADILAPPKAAPNATGIPSIPQLDEGFKERPLSPASDLQRKHVEWRRLRNAVQNDRNVKAALKRAEAARTDLEKRKLLGRYYDLLYAKVSARAAPDMKKYLADRKKESLGALPQPRVRPEVSMSQSSEDSPPASPSPSIAPSPSPSSDPDLQSRPREVQP